MPEKDGKLTQEEKDKAREWLMGKDPKKCEVCGTNTWSLSDYLYTPMSLTQGLGVSLGNSVTPLITLTCANCSNTRFFNALVMEIVPPNQQESKEQEGGEKQDA